MLLHHIGNVNELIALLSLPKLAFVLLKTAGDCESFYIDYYGRNKYAIDDLLDYREDKLANSNITLDMFLDMCHNKGKQYAFETTFLQHINSDSLHLIEERVAEGSISLIDIYMQFQKNKNKNVMKYVL